IPGATQRRGPAHETGDARSLQIGSVRRLRPLSWMSRLACPAHVTVSCDSGARGGTKSGGTRVNTDGSGSFGRGRVVRCTSIHFRRLPKPGTAWSTHGLRNPPPGRRGDGSGAGLTAGQERPTERGRCAEGRELTPRVVARTCVAATLVETRDAEPLCLEP